MLIANNLERLFFMEEKGQQIKLSDPNTHLSPEAVLNFYSNSYPVLTTATIDGPKVENDAVVYTFKSTIGTKG